MASDIEISDLRDVPEFTDIMADRLWTAWWRDEGRMSREELGAMIGDAITSSGIPLALIAHRGDVFCGTVSVIEDDLPIRPHYGPWLAALWVEAHARRQGIAESLIDAARARAAYLTDVLHLYCTPENTPFYERRGWLRVETDVGGVNIFRRATRG